MIVLIYGGGFHSGSASTNLYGPDFLMQKEVVLVTFNYRLSALGFMSFEDPSLKVPGNAALKDQRMALQWIKSNIEAFGGDPNRITVIGQSAGACSLHHHLLAPSSANLFNRAIIMSGSANVNWGICEAQGMGERLAKSIGWDGEGGETGAYNFLMAADAEKLTKASASEILLNKEDHSKDIRHTFGPKVEKYETGTSFCLKYPSETIKTCWSSDMEVIFWYTSNECLYFYDASFLQYAFEKGVSSKILVPYELKMKMDEVEINEKTARMKVLYNEFNSKQDIMDVGINFSF